MSNLSAQPDPERAREYFSDKMEFTTGPVELKRAIDAEEVVMVDVRDADDYARGHIPGAVSYPKAKWGEEVDLRFDKTNVIYCYSQVCHLAAAVAILLADRGYPVKELEGGFEGWKEHDLPVETGAPASGESDAVNDAYASNQNDDRAGGAGATSPADRSPRQENL